MTKKLVQKYIKLSRKALKKEHTELVKVLKSGNRKAQLKEAKEQKEEAKHY